MKVDETKKKLVHTASWVNQCGKGRRSKFRNLHREEGSSLLTGCRAIELSCLLVSPSYFLQWDYFLSPSFPFMARAIGHRSAGGGVAPQLDIFNRLYCIPALLALWRQDTHLFLQTSFPVIVVLLLAVHSSLSVIFKISIVIFYLFYFFVILTRSNETSK